jgi:D-3-phosphoglycerate dehydrogenase
MKKVVCLYGTASEMTEKMNERAEKYAASRNLKYEWVPQQPWSAESAVEALRDSDAGIIDVEPYDEKIFSRIKDRCHLLVRYGVGFDAVNLKDASENQIAVARTTGANSESVAEMAFAMIMAAKRNFRINDSNVREGRWGRTIGQEMLGKKLGILGFGAIGKKLAALFSGFHVETAVYDPFLSKEQAEAAGVKSESLEKIFSTCDAISIHVPYTEDTRHLINAERLALMKETAVIVCTSRGNIVDEEALAEALKKHQILGAGLDVFAEEPLPADSPLIGLDNVILTPHVSAQTEDALWNMYKKAIDISADFLEGKDIGGDLLNPEYKG